MAIDGYTGPYCQYAYARIAGIIRNSNNLKKDSLEKKIDYSKLGNDEERALLQKLIDFPDEIEKSAQELNPQRVANAVFEIAKAFNLFYANNKVLYENNS